MKRALQRLEAWLLDDAAPRHRRTIAWLCVLGVVLAVLAVKAIAADVTTIYVAPHATDKPVLVLVHGGGWVSGSSEQTRPWAEALNRKGYPVVNVAYRLASATVHADKLVLDVTRQVRSARRHHRMLGTSSRKVVVIGFSAGGQLATLLTARGIADGAIAFSAPTKLAASSPGLAAVAETFVGCSQQECPQKWLALSPSAYETTRPLFLAYGAHELLVPPSQGDAIRDASKRVVRVPGNQHSGAVYPGGWEAPLLDQGLEYVTSHLAGARGGRAVAT